MGLQESKQRVFSHISPQFFTEQFGQNKKRPKKLICFEFSCRNQKDKPFDLSFFIVLIYNFISVIFFIQRDLQCSFYFSHLSLYITDNLAALRAVISETGKRVSVYALSADEYRHSRGTSHRRRRQHPSEALLCRNGFGG